MNDDVGFQVQLSKEVDSLKKAELSFTSAKERATDLEGRLQRLSNSAEREKSILKEELQHLQDDSKFSARKMTADVRFMLFVYQLCQDDLILFFISFSLSAWLLEQKVQKENQSC